MSNVCGIVFLMRDIIFAQGDIMEKNFCIKCDVTKCRYNADGVNCGLGSIKVTCGCDSCTCCGDYVEKE